MANVDDIAKLMTVNITSLYSSTSKSAPTAKPAQTKMRRPLAYFKIVSHPDSTPEFCMYRTTLLLSATSDVQGRIPFNVAKHFRMFIACKTDQLCNSIWSKYAQDYAQIPNSAVPLHPCSTLSRKYISTEETTACLRNENVLETDPLPLQPRHSQVLTCGRHRHQPPILPTIPTPAQLSGPKYM
jgi:hypothetical protein